MARALMRAAAAAALRRSGTGATPHRAAALGPQLPRFGRIRATCCYRMRGPPDSEESSHKGLEHLDDLNRGALLQYAKKVTVDKETLLKGQCQYSPVQADINMRNLKNDLQDMSNRIDQLQKSSEKHRDVTSIYVKNVGSFNVLAIGMVLFTVYQVWGHKAMPSAPPMWTKPVTF